MRTFIAIELSNQLKHHLDEAIASLRQLPSAELVRWVPSESVHLTLKFLGEIGGEQLTAVQQALEGGLAGQAGFSFRTGKSIGCFPKWWQPRVYWIGVEGDQGRLAKTNSLIEGSLAPLGIKAEGRPFHPHLTIGRVKPDAGGQQLTELSEKLRNHELQELGVIQVRQVSLMKSDLRPTGAVHTRVHAVELSQARPRNARSQ